VSPQLLITSDPRYNGTVVLEGNLTLAAERAGAVLKGQLDALAARGIALPLLYEIGNEDYAHFNFCYAARWSDSTTDDAARYVCMCVCVGGGVHSFAVAYGSDASNVVVSVPFSS
jgi:hypothetical protein